MRKLFSLIIALSLLCSAKAQQNYQTVSAEEFAKEIANDSVIIIDVRTESEYSENHIPKAINIDVQKEDFEEKVGKINTTQAVAIYCRSGRRSKKAAAIMLNKGFTKIIELGAGFNSWIATFPDNNINIPNKKIEK